MEQGNVNLTISKEIVTPIVQAKINEAIITAMGGSEQILAKVVQDVLTRKVDRDGKTSSYSSDNKHNWIDIVVTQQIHEAVKEAMTEILTSRKEQIRDAIKKQLSSQKGINAFAESLVSATAKTFESMYSSSISVEFNKKNKDW